MQKDCVLNELSIGDIDVHRHDVLSLMEQLGKLREIVGAERISMWHEIRTPKTDTGHRVNKQIGVLRGMARRASPRDKDKWQRALRLFDRAEEFTDELAEEVQFDRAPAYGLGRAHRLGAIALSLGSGDRWIEPWLRVRIMALQTSSGMIEERTGDVRHASESKHLDQHIDWQPLQDMDRLRILLETSLPRHMPASNYCGGKHVKGTTNDERKENARKPGGVNQYLAARGGEPVADHVISRWEQQALEQVKSARSPLVERRGNTYFVYCDLGEPVGYQAPLGEFTSWIRVEWSSRAVHSHPRRPPI